MDYEEITDNLINKAMEGFKMKEIYQEFLDSNLQFQNFKNVDLENFKNFKDYLDKEDNEE